MRQMGVVVLLLASLSGVAGQAASVQSGKRAPAPGRHAAQTYEHAETRRLVALVNEGAELVRSRGQRAFSDFRRPGSRWRQGESYLFVLDLEGNMRVHPDRSMEGKAQMELKDVDGRPIVRDLLAATSLPNKPEGWTHYQWPVPGGLLPRWKSSYVRRVTAPDGKQYVIGSGMYDDRMERPFVVDTVNAAVAQIERKGQDAYPLFRDPIGHFRAKDTYVFVIDRDGVEVVNPGFPNLEGRNLMEMKDTQGKTPIREMLDLVSTRGSGWVDYMWPKPGESVPTQKSAYVSKARLGDQWVMVGSGVYLADAPKAARIGKKLTAPELMSLVRDAAALVEKEGEQAYSELRTKGSRWFRDDTYVFVWTADGTRVFHAADPASEGQDARDLKDILGRPIGRMFLEAARSPTGEGWVHYMYPEPGDIFPAWKSAFVKRATYPSGKGYLIGCGIYNMQMDKAFIEDVVNRAAALVADQGTGAFSALRDKKGPFMFMDTYVFINKPDGSELVNGGQPSLEGKNLMNERDARGKALVREYIDTAMNNGSGWVDYHWYRPGSNTPELKLTYVKRVQSGPDTYIVGSGFYPGDARATR